MRLAIAPRTALPAMVLLLVGCMQSGGGQPRTQPNMLTLSTAAYAYRARVADQIPVDSLERNAKELRFVLRSAIMRQRWGKDEARYRQSWAVPAGITTIGGSKQLAVVTTRCVLDYRYPVEGELPQWSNLALFSSSGPAPSRPDVRPEVFRLNAPTVLPGITVNYDPKRDGIFFTSREYLDGPLGERYFGQLTTGSVPNGWATLPIGDWNNTNGVDLAIVYLPLADPGTAALSADRNLGMANPETALQTVFKTRNLWGDTFRFDMVSRECMKYGAADLQAAEDDAARYRMLAIAAGAVLAVAYFAPTLVGIDAQLLDRLSEHVAQQAVSALWRTATPPLPGSAVRGASWNQFGKLVLHVALEDGRVRDFIVGGLQRLGLDQEEADAVLGLLQQLLAASDARIATMERIDGPPVASVMLPSAQLDLAADLLRRGMVRLDPTDVALLAQQPTLVKLAQDAVEDPDVRSALIQDESYRRALREVAATLGR